MNKAQEENRALNKAPDEYEGVASELVGSAIDAAVVESMPPEEWEAEQASGQSCIQLSTEY
jgi:hypothetical protein